MGVVEHEATPRAAQLGPRALSAAWQASSIPLEENGEAAFAMTVLEELEGVYNTSTASGMAPAQMAACLEQVARAPAPAASLVHGRMRVGPCLVHGLPNLGRALLACGALPSMLPRPSASICGRFGGPETLGGHGQQSPIIPAGHASSSPLTPAACAHTAHPTCYIWKMGRAIR